ncbi:MAG TPA: CAP domain-containing protein [Labilithrix sp.]
MRARWITVLALAFVAIAGDAAACPRVARVHRSSHPQAQPQPQANASSFDQYNLDRINDLRRRAGVAPLVLDARLEDFARAGSAQLMRDHVPHAHFQQAGSSLWNQGFQGNAHENQGANTGWPRAANDPNQNERAQIDQILDAMMREGPGGGHHDAILDPKMKRVGVGLLEDGKGQLYLTNDFSA